MKSIGVSERMRGYEAVYDTILPTEGYIVIRLDGRSFTRLTQSPLPCEKPFDGRFKDWMITTTKALLDSGITGLYAYTQSDEVSVLLSKADSFYNHRLMKLASVLASTAGATFSLAAGKHATFDAKVLVLPSVGEVASYFDWRQCDCVKNALNNYCYWSMRHAGLSYEETTELLKGKNTKAKIELLKTIYGIDFEAVPAWQKYGIGMHYEIRERIGVNRLTGAGTHVERLTRILNDALPTGSEYRTWLKSLITKREGL